MGKTADALIDLSVKVYRQLGTVVGMNIAFPKK